MNDRLVTVATFDNAFQAEYAKSLLEDTGIRAIVADAELVSMAWHLSTAVGGIKVQVWEPDAERSEEILERDMPNSEDEIPLDDAELARQALEEDREQYDGEDSDSLLEPGETLPIQEDSPAAIDRERIAARAFMIAWFGFAILPLSFYAFYLVLCAAFGEGELTARGRRLLIGAFLVTGASLALAWVFLYLVTQ